MLIAIQGKAHFVFHLIEVLSRVDTTLGELAELQEKK
jgi:hypothetical protein